MLPHAAACCCVLLRAAEQFAQHKQLVHYTAKTSPAVSSHGHVLRQSIQAHTSNLYASAGSS